ncbi:hypothetical protein ACWD5Q_35260 [Streptomyces sp. NPDC002513]
MKIGTFTGMTNVLLLILAAALIIFAVLHLAGVRTRKSKNQPAKKALPVLLSGIGIGLGTLSRIPADHRAMWSTLLLPPSMLLMIASAYLYLRYSRIS